MIFYYVSNCITNHCIYYTWRGGAFLSAIGRQFRLWRKKTKTKQKKSAPPMHVGNEPGRTSL